MNFSQITGFISPVGLQTSTLIAFILLLSTGVAHSEQKWIKIDDFEKGVLSEDWVREDTRNDTHPRIENPQVTRVNRERLNHFLIKKPANEGVVGNRKALTFKPLPEPVPVGALYTFYIRINVEYFPNNHVFGLSDMSASDITQNDYNALEPSIRVTDKTETDGTLNDGTLMVRAGNGYSKINNPGQHRVARPMQTNTWYEIWLVINNNPLHEGGQKYDVYVRGGDEFPAQQLVFEGADFRMKRERPLIYFLANCNTGPADHPYGNGGLRYDDLFMARGALLSTPGDTGY